ncbi:MAG: Ldh family oxidoreductase [Chloroflexota bacterium]
MATYRVIAPAGLQQYVQQIVRGMGADEEIAREVARHLVRANLSGHDSHGVIRVAQYHAQAETGDLVPSARPSLARETAVTALVDAHRGFGHFSTRFALDWAMTRAQEHGIAAAAVRHSSHIGRVGEYGELAAERGLMVVATVGLAGSFAGGMVPYGGSERFFAANPWVMSAPAAQYPPFLFDGSTATVAEGKVRVARDKGVQLPPGCIIDKDGNPTTDPNAFYAGGAILPLGGEVAGHKGYGLAMASSLFGGLAMIDDPDYSLIGASVHRADADKRGRIAGVFLAVINPAMFGDPGHYRAMVDETIAAAKRVPPAAGRTEILVPGEPEIRTRAQREGEGVSLPEATWQGLVDVAQRFGVAEPAHQVA